jgi:hypothetical protein
MVRVSWTVPDMQERRSFGFGRTRLPPSRTPLGTIAAAQQELRPPNQFVAGVCDAGSSCKTGLTEAGYNGSLFRPDGQ